MRQYSYWYRAAEDPETSIRPHAQMIANAPAEETLASLRAQGYRVQRVTSESLCDACQGIGTEPYRPKGWKRSIRRDFLPRRPCSACHGSPVLESETFTF